LGDGAWSSSSASLIPENVPTSIFLGVASTSINTLGDTVVFTAYLRNSSGNVAKSGVTINFELSGAAGGSISATSANTDANGMASTTYTSGSSGGTATVKATSTGLTESSASVTVNLRTGLTPSLTASGTSKGVSFSNTNHSSSYTYALASGPTSGTLESGDSYNNSQFDILTSRARDARPSVTVNSTNKTATTSNTTFVNNSSVSLSVRSSRSGYTSVTSNVATDTANITVSSRTYSWQFSTDNGASWRTDWPAAFSGTASQTLSWTGTPNSRRIRCQVTSNLSNGATDTATTTNEPTIP
jgi:hypothetical protein